MDASTLATIMLEWETAQRQADALRAEIEAAVLALGKTQTVGNVRATFSAGRRTFDYQAAIDAALDTGAVDPKDMAAFEYLDVDYFSVVESAVAGGLLSGEYLDTYTTVKTDYTSAVKALGLEAPVLEQKPPSVTVKLLA